jgi:hypothetical protein
VRLVDARPGPGLRAEVRFASLPTRRS